MQATLPTTAPDAPAPARIRWVEVPCPLCGSDESRPIIEAADPTPPTGGLRFAVVECRRCRAKFTNPRPDAASIGQFYPSDYQPHRRPRQLGRPMRRWVPLGAIRGRASERRSLPWQGQGRLLDFGCGGGSFLARMAEQGWKVTGLDASVGAVREVQTALGLHALVGSLPHPELEPASFDVITMWHSLEHVHEPLAILAAARDLLVPGGKLLIAVPNIGSWPFRWFGPSWFGLDLPRHLTHFEPHSLRAALEKAGFAVDSLRCLRHSDWLRSSARLARRRNEAGGWKRLLQLKPLARLAAWACYAAGQSDCILAVAHK